MDSRIGKRGDDGYRPSRTISHQPVMNGLTTRDIGDGYYVVIDPFPTVNVDETISELQATLPTRPEETANAKSPKTRRGVAPDSKQSGDAVSDALHDD